MANSKNMSKEYLYAFRYKAKGADNKTLSVYDRSPFVLFLAFGPDKALGVNAHWIPAPMRKQFLLDVIELSKKIGKNGKMRIVPKLYYQMVKTNAKLRIPAMKAIRLYFYTRMTRVIAIPADQWLDSLRDSKYKARRVTRARGYKH